LAIKLLTFDLDHTLWDPTPALIAAEQAMHQWIAENSPATARFYPPEAIREYRNQLAEAYPEFRDKLSELRFDTLRRVFMQSGHHRDQAHSMATQAFDAFYQVRSRLTLFSGVDEVMQQLKQQYHIAAVTNGNADLTLAGFDHYFDGHFNADNHGAAKPAPDMFLAALSQAEATPAETLHIGDHPEQDIAAAAALGIQTIWYNEKEAEWPLSNTQPTATFSHWSQLVPLVQALANN
jgi:HAD superfamily hydrolase (TIGR01509 family)